MASRNRCAASQVVPRVGEHCSDCTEAVVRPGLRTIASRLALADLHQSSLKAYHAPSAISASYVA
eukprot:scaffold116761_cov54-Phaeocystis_antarctica.AAC.2